MLMQTSRTVSYKGWLIAIHCERIHGDQAVPRYTAIGILSGEIGMGSRQSNSPAPIIHFAGTTFDAPDEAAKAILKEAKRQIDSDSLPP